MELAEAVTESAPVCQLPEEQGRGYASGDDGNLLMLAEIACGQRFQ